MKKMSAVAAIGAAFVLGFVAHGVVSEPVAHAQSARVYELRTYTAPEGKLEELHARFRNHTMRIFQKHGMTNVAYFRPEDSPLKENTLIGQGPWGGNIDTRDIAAGHKIHLNATHDGGLLFLGDVHASQGDSELTAIANETAADVTLTCDVLKNRTTPGVCRIETP